MIARLLLLGAVGLVTMGAQSSCSASYGDPDGIDDPGSGGPTFTTTLVLKDSAGAVRSRFQRGELITMELSVRNRTDQVQRVTFADGGHQDYIVFDDGTHRLRWRWSADKSFTQVVSEETFDAHETKIFTTTWDQVLASGAMLETGTYEARGMFMIMAPGADLQAPHERASTLVPFTITP